MKNIPKFNEFLNGNLNEGKIAKGAYVRYTYKGEVTGGQVESIKGDTVEVHNWDGSTVELELKDLEYEPTWNPMGPK